MKYCTRSDFYVPDVCMEPYDAQDKFRKQMGLPIWQEQSAQHQRFASSAPRGEAEYTGGAGDFPTLGTAAKAPAWGARVANGLPPPALAGEPETYVPRSLRV